MHRVIQHDTIASGILNNDYTGGTSQYAVWKDDLCNTPALLELLSKRLASDYVNLNAKMRKAVSPKDLDAWLRTAWC